MGYYNLHMEGVVAGDLPVADRDAAVRTLVVNIRNSSYIPEDVKQDLVDQATRQGWAEWYGDRPGMYFQGVIEEA